MLNMDHEMSKPSGLGRHDAPDLADIVAAFPHPDDLPDTASGQVPDRDRALSALRDLIGDAAMIAHDMRALTYLFTKAVCDDGQDTRLTSASHLVIDCIETMAARLDALEVKAAAVYGPFVPGAAG